MLLINRRRSVDIVVLTVSFSFSVSFLLQLSLPARLALAACIVNYGFDQLQGEAELLQQNVIPGRFCYGDDVRNAIVAC